jgi:hypothetical protein
VDSLKGMVLAQVNGILALRVPPPRLCFTFLAFRKKVDFALQFCAALHSIPHDSARFYTTTQNGKEQAGMFDLLARCD